ncbi:hypothetical protein BJG01_11210 [Vibrio splendidus]|nr:hypothetical protein BJG01_11210 [Vibrio splendidus]
MSKLLKLKKYLTIDDAARYLSKSLEEPVTIADIYELALDNELTVSVRIINQAFAVAGQYIDGQCDENNQLEVDTNLLTGEPLDTPYSISLDEALQVEEDKWLVFDKTINAIEGLWDLAMIGLERQKIHELYQDEVNGAEPKLSGANGFFLQREELIYWVQTSLNLNVTNDDSSALQTRLYSLLKSKGLTVNEVANSSYALDVLNDDELDEFSALSLALSETEQEGAESPQKLIGSDEYLDLDDFSYQFVIRTGELTRFVQSLAENQDPSTQNDKPLAVKERITYLSLIRAFCLDSKIDPYARGAATPIQKISELSGEELSNETIRQILLKIKKQWP